MFSKHRRATRHDWCTSVSSVTTLGLFGMMASANSVLVKLLSRLSDKMEGVGAHPRTVLFARTFISFLSLPVSNFSVTTIE